MRRFSFTPDAFEDFQDWAKTDKKIYFRIVELIKDAGRNPFSGIGKPELLKHELKGLWSRRINGEHRLVYRVREEEIIIYSCKFHYRK